MKCKTRLYKAALAGSKGLALVTVGFDHFAVAQDVPRTKAELKQPEQKKPDYSPYPDQNFPKCLGGKHDRAA